jgi:hypothetical protein
MPRLLGTWALSLAVYFGMAVQVLAEPQRLALELNKLEPSEKGCRAYLLIDNQGETALASFKLDLVLFQPDGVIGKRLALDLAPVRAKKRTVKTFELDGMACDRIASLLVNDVIDCKSEGGQAVECLNGLGFKSLVGNVAVSK